MFKLLSYEFPKNSSLYDHLPHIWLCDHKYMKENEAGKELSDRKLCDTQSYEKDRS